MTICPHCNKEFKQEYIGIMRGPGGSQHEFKYTLTEGVSGQIMKADENGNWGWCDPTEEDLLRDKILREAE